MKSHKQIAQHLFASIIMFALLTSSSVYGQVVIGGSLPGVSDVAVGASGNIYATVSGACTLAIIMPDGQKLDIGKSGNGDGQFSSNSPFAVVLDEEQNIYVTDSGNKTIRLRIR
jgi:streptogramin lyase